MDPMKLNSDGDVLVHMAYYLHLFAELQVILLHFFRSSRTNKLPPEDEQLFSQLQPCRILLAHPLSNLCQLCFFEYHDLFHHISIRTIGLSGGMTTSVDINHPGQ